MTTSALTAMLVAALTTQVDLSPLVQEIQGNGYSRVAVCPRPVIMNGQERTTVDDIALLATEQIQQITQQLIASAQGTYKVIDSEVAMSAIQGMTVEDLSNPDVRRRIGQQTGAGAMVFVFAEHNAESGQWDLFWKLIELQDSSVAVQGTETIDIILSDAAYMGESFEARRWGPQGLDVVCFGSQLPREWAMGVGPEWERIQYASLQQIKNTLAAEGQQMLHPLENPDVPYGIELVVNGQPVVPERICDKLYVPIDPAAGPPGQGPDVGIRMYNRSGHKVFMGIYIDGVNMINQQRELPIMTPTRRHWVVRDGYDAVLRNWYHLSPGRTEQRSRFQLVDTSQSVSARTGLPPGGEKFAAFGERIDDRLGMITCLVYTYGWEGVDFNATPPKQRNLNGRFAFGQGALEETRIRWEPGERGILLAAMTLHYRTPGELDQIRSIGCGEAAAAATTAVQPRPESAAPTQPSLAETLATKALEAIAGESAAQEPQPVPATEQPASPAETEPPAANQQPVPSAEPQLPGEDAPFPGLD